MTGTLIENITKHLREYGEIKINCSQWRGRTHVSRSFSLFLNDKGEVRCALRQSSVAKASRVTVGGVFEKLEMWERRAVPSPSRIAEQMSIDRGKRDRAESIIGLSA